MRPDGHSPEALLVAHVQELTAAREAGVPIVGYLDWTPTDNYECGSFDARFGLWRVEVRSGDLTRHETPTVAIYRENVEADGVTCSLARRFGAPAKPPAAHRALTPGARCP